MNLKRLFTAQLTPMIHPYRGFGSRSSVVVIGRITTSQSLGDIVSASNLQHALRLVRSYAAKPIPNITVRIDFAESHTTVTTNEAGFFEATLQHAELTTATLDQWHTATMSLPDYPEISPIETPIMIEAPSNTFGIISDIDDTVLISNATNKIKLLYTTIFKSPERRLPFPGVSQLYHALVRGTDELSNNPIFYVSSSPWSLYEFLNHFFNLNHLPTGPLLLKSTPKLRSVFTTAGKHHQKRDAIVKILTAFPRLQFVLIGDSGQHDEIIYSDIAASYPGRIKAIYIRELNLKSRAVVTDTILETNSLTPIVHGKTSVEISKHAFKHGLITQASLHTVESKISHV